MPLGPLLDQIPWPLPRAMDGSFELLVAQDATWADLRRTRRWRAKMALRGPSSVKLGSAGAARCEECDSAMHGPRAAAGGLITGPEKGLGQATSLALLQHGLRTPESPPPPRRIADPQTCPRRGIRSSRVRAEGTSARTIGRTACCRENSEGKQM